MSELHQRLKLSVLASTVMLLLLTGCNQPSDSNTTTSDSEELKPRFIPLTTAVCELEPELCTQSCAKCTDKKACFANNGICALAGLDFNDNGDINIDIFAPGCHQEYPAGQCPNNPTFFLGDVCGTRNPKNLIEWTDSNCHGPTGDRKTFNCNTECLRLQLGNGTCKVVTNACGPGNNSAICKCDIAPPTP